MRLNHLKASLPLGRLKKAMIKNLGGSRAIGIQDMIFTTTCLTLDIILTNLPKAQLPCIILIFEMVVPYEPFSTR
jgi:hypothetical protein